MTKSILQIEDLHVSYDSIEALHGVSLEVAEGSIACLIGANGAGKSTVLKTISGLKRPSQGRILFKDRPIQSVAPHALVAQGLVQCPEGRGVFPNLTVEENLELGAYARPDGKHVRNDLSQVYVLFPRLQDRSRQVAGTLSGGEQQMLAMGRALMAKPSLLLLDEPSLGLAPQVVEGIFETIQKINREGVTVLLVEQNAHLALEVADTATVLETGHVLLHGPADKVAKNPKVIEAYLGRSE
jgi:branched-chain amino acid transport system ATP-binding protein